MHECVRRIRTSDAVDKAAPILDDIPYDVSRLRHLLDVALDLVTGMDFERNGRRDVDLDRVAALLSIARDQAAHIEAEIDRNFDETIGRVRS